MSIDIQKSNRDSNFELLRLICMFYILLHHFMVHGLRNIGYYSPFVVSEYTNFCAVFNSFVVIGVNCFVLISGYYEIKCRWKVFFHLYLLCVFYSVGIYLVSCYMGGSYSIKSLFFSFFPFSRNPNLWFISTYIYLYLISPILNKIIDISDKRGHIVILLICSIITFYYGYFWRGEINDNGYNLINFIFLYFIGRFLYNHIAWSKYSVRKIRLNALFTYIICSLLISVIAVIDLNFNWSYFAVYTYNSPLVIISSVAFFIFFRTLHFQSCVINWAASSVLAIYLIHENKHLRSYYMTFVSQVDSQSDNGWILALSLLLLAICIMSVCILIDKARMIIVSPVERFINRINWEEKINMFIDKIVKRIDNQ